MLVAFVPGEKVVRPSARGLLYAVGAGLAIGAFLIIIDQTSDESGLVPLIVNRSVSTLITSAVVGILAIGAVRGGRRAASVLVATSTHLGATPTGHADLEHAGAARRLASIRIGRARIPCLPPGGSPRGAASSMPWPTW